MAQLNVWQFLKQLNIQQLCPPAIIVVLGIYPRERKMCVHPKVYIQMSIVALFIIPSNWKQPRRPSMDKW